MTRRLADAYMRQGQYSSALMEYEGILLHDPDSAEIKALIADLETKLHQGKGGSQSAITLDFSVAEVDADAASGAPAGSKVEPTLIATAATRVPEALLKNLAPSLEQDANEPLARFLVQHRLAPQNVVDAALQQVRYINSEIQANPNTPAIAGGLLEEIINAGIEAEPLLSAILDRTKFAYAPLEYYDIDRQVVKMLPDNLTLGRRVVVFDIISRTMLVALDNPFDAPVKAIVQQSVDFHVQWHLAMPSVIHRILRDTYRLTS